MSLEHILLGLLKQPATGYELRKEFQEGIQHFWSAELGQIYPTLERMERRRWLKSRTEPSEKGPARRVYTRTAEGTKALIEWLKSEPIMGKERFAYIGQLVFMGELEDLERTREFIAQLREKLAGVHRILKGGSDDLKRQFDADPHSLSNQDFHDLISIRMGVRSLGAKVRWCDEALEMIDLRLAREAAHV